MKPAYCNDSVSLFVGDCLELLRTLPDASVDMVFCSPPYEAARTYGVGFNLRGQDWVDWAAERFLECYRVSRGLVAWVVEGQTRRFQWSNNTATGEPPRYARGGRPSNRRKAGLRETRCDYNAPPIANPGNVIKCTVGGGKLGNPLAHENEAPFPESLAFLFVVSFCPPGGVVLDPFNGSGTTAAVAIANGRRALGCDIRQSQIDLTLRRLGLNHSSQSAERGAESSSVGAQPNRMAAQTA